MAEKAALEGVRVLELSGLYSAYCGKMLAYLDDDVIKIESSRSLDSLRLAAPYKDGIKGVIAADIMRKGAGPATSEPLAISASCGNGGITL
ncbi:MAG: CoA transferase [Sphingomonadaceae bacterium]